MPLTPKEMVKLLKQNGFIEVAGGRGSHKKLINPVTKTTVIVPFHVKDLKKGLEQAILKQAGLKKREKV
jgi:predicted RNA binding protein YcfA (HicA-like mRNA interferase family)